ncbi:hypothetical protein SteCoe_3565 [Stentor coeruleus]|uniref:Core domain-containing protein n=1 Tax=Stentor coeruleus TaxID=5963 RepID=A0A1R2CWQ3_9CILI|nr:hypothetical protein SteCoe_3565 [Stentor coeruleus]
MNSLVIHRLFATRNVMSITQEACRRLREITSKDSEEGKVLRLGVKKRGCNGLSYTMDYVKERGKMDELVEVDGIKVIVDAKAIMFVIGTTMDFINTPTRQEFIFNNPNAKSTCGCGESFNI